MDKSRLFIASSGRTLLVAEMLRDELRTPYCEPTLWSEESRLQPGSTIIEMLEEAARQFDFAVVILARDDVMIGGDGEGLKARDNCVFEAGLFMATIGRRRCFLVNSVRQSDLPSDLHGIISIPFEEPADLTDRSACAQAIARVAAQLKNIVQAEGPSQFHAHVPLLSFSELFRRERPQSDGGDLQGGQVIVCDTQPWADVERGALIRRNMDCGTSYHYFLQFSDDTIEKLCLALQMVVWAGLGGASEASDFRSRVEAVRNNKARVLDDLKHLCETSLLRVTLGVDDPIVCFRVHNASSPNLARFYSKYYKDAFVLWAEGRQASALWQAFPRFLEDDTGDRLLLPPKFAGLSTEQKKRLESMLGRALSRYFPGMDLDVRTICLGGGA